MKRNEAGELLSDENDIEDDEAMYTFLNPVTKEPVTMSGADWKATWTEPDGRMFTLRERKLSSEEKLALAKNLLSVVEPDAVIVAVDGKGVH